MLAIERHREGARDIRVGLGNREQRLRAFRRILPRVSHAVKIRREQLPSLRIENQRADPSLVARERKLFLRRQFPHVNEPVKSARRDEFPAGTEAAANQLPLVFDHLVGPRFRGIERGGLGLFQFVEHVRQPAVFFFAHGGFVSG